MSSLGPIPGGGQTYSKNPAAYPEDGPQQALYGGRGHLFTEKGEFIDWVMALGALPLGYADPDVQRAIREQLDSGSIFSLAHPLELEVARRLLAIHPWADGVRYGKNGSDATSGAVRAARAFTGRDVILTEGGYHGWQDWSCPNPVGIPEAVRALSLDLEEGPRTTPSKAAALIVEPDRFEARHPGGLRHLRRSCDEHGLVLIFDEIVSGFRAHLGGATALYGVTPDILCLGKALSNGMPLSAIVGKSQYMEVFNGGIGYSFTYGGEALSLAAARATIDKFAREPVIDRIAALGQRLLEGFNRAAVGTPVRASGWPYRVVIEWPDAYWRTAVQERMQDRGILLAYGFMPSYAHTDEDVDRTILALTETFEAIAAENGPRPRGRLVAGPYRR